MHFCNKCDNMYYIRISTDDENKLIYYCRNCGHEDTELTKDNICVSKTQLKRSEQKYNHIINEYTKQDPTLPRIYNMNCPNAVCKTNTEENEKPEILYIRYDENNLKYIYMCSTCDTTWKTDDKK